MNEDRKKRWLAKKNTEVISAEGYYDTKIKNTEKFEDMFKKDLCEFTASEIISMYKTMNTYSPSTIYINNGIYADYTAWCINEGFVPDSQNHFLEITRNMCNDYVNKVAFDKRIVSREEVLDWCRDCWNEADKYLLLGLFEGIKGNHFIDFTDTGVDDIEGNVINLASGRKLEFSDELIRFAHNSAEEKVWTSYTSERNIPLNGGDEIIRFSANARTYQTLNKARRILQRSKFIFDHLGIREFMSMNSIRISGMIYFINTNAKKLDMGSYDYIVSHTKEIENRYMPTNGFYCKYKDYLV